MHTPLSLEPLHPPPRLQQPQPAVSALLRASARGQGPRWSLPRAGPARAPEPPRQGGRGDWRRRAGSLPSPRVPARPGALTSSAGSLRACAPPGTPPRARSWPQRSAPGLGAHSRRTRPSRRLRQSEPRRAGGGGAWAPDSRCLRAGEVQAGRAPQS